MGYVRNTVYKLEFEDPAMQGLEVRAKSVPLKSILKLTKLTGRDLKQLPMQEQLDTMSDMIGMFADALVGWNLENEDSTPVPADRDGLESQDFDFVMQIITAWMDALMAVAAPLGKRSPYGDLSLEASLPMEPLSVNLPS